MLKYNLKKFIQKLQLFDYVILGVFALLAISFAIFFLRQDKFITVKVKITDQVIPNSYGAPPSWFAYFFKKGMKEKDGLGRTTVEIIDVYHYNTERDKRTVYLTTQIRAVYNSRTGEYRYKGSPLSIGNIIRINFEQIYFEGLVVESDFLPDPYKYEDIVVKAEIQEYTSFPNTTGVDQYVADSLIIGDKVYDSSGKTIAEILSKEVTPAKISTIDQYGNIYLKRDPRRKDITLNLKLWVKRVENQLFFLDDRRVAVWENLPLNFSSITIWPTITEILTK